MKKVIEGRLYNTDTAKCLGEWSNNIGYGDLNYLCETLYRTKSGAYFLYGEGGANTKYSISEGNNSWSGGEHIQPMDLDAAKEWAEEYLSGDEYIEAFGEPEETDDAKEPLNISITIGLKNRLTRIKEETGKSISQIIEDKFNE